MFKIEFSTLSPEQLLLLVSKKLQYPIENWEISIWQFIQEWFNPSVNAVQVQTSGSTGKPKLIRHHKQAMLNSAALTCQALELKPGNTCLLCLPANKIGGMMMLVRCIYNKMDCYCIRPSATPLDHLPVDLQIDFAAFTPMQFFQITQGADIFKKAERISKVILGGEDVGHKLLQQMRTMQNEVYITFGMTETISHIALKRISGNNPGVHFSTLPGISVKSDENRCLIIEASALEQHELHTNEVVNIFSDTQFDWLGRVDNVINTGGVKVHPEELEQQLKAAINYPFFIGSIKDELTGEKIVLVIESETPLQDEITRLENLLTQFDRIRRPKEILFAPKFDRTENGKIKRKMSLDKY